MGASSWLYFVPYQEDIEQALQALRQQVFAAGDYHDFSDPYYPEEEPEVVDMDGKEIFPPLPPPQTIEDLLRRSQPEDTHGTHSILDIGSVIPDPHLYWDPPLDEALVRFRNTSQPSREVVEWLLRNEHFWPPFLDFLQFEETRTPEELVEAFLTEQDRWESIHREVCEWMEFITWYAKMGKAIPMSKNMLLRYFGTTRPTLEQAHQVFKQGDIWDVMGRWIGYYAVLYTQEVPTHLVFAGSSGD